MPRSVTRMLEGSFASAMVCWIPVRSLAQILAHRSHVNVHNALDLIVVHLGRRLKIHQLHHRIERGRLLQIRRAQRNLLQVQQIVDGRFAVLVILHGQKVIVAGFIVHPVIRRDHDVGIQRRDHVIDHVFLRQPQLARMHAVDVHAEGRIVHVLRNIDLADAGQFADARAPDPARCCRLRPRSRVFTCTSIGAGMPLIENRVHHRAALEERAHFGKLRGDLVLAPGPYSRSCSIS